MQISRGAGYISLRSLLLKLSPDDLAAIVSAAVAKWERDAPAGSVEALEKLIDIVAIRRTFFKRDRRLYDDGVAVTAAGKHLWNMSGYLDAGRERLWHNRSRKQPMNSADHC